MHWLDRSDEQQCQTRPLPLSRPICQPLSSYPLPKGKASCSLNGLAIRFVYITGESSMKFLLLLIVVVPWEPLVILVVVYVARKAGLVTARSLPTLSLASWFTLPSYLHLIRWPASLAQERPRECSGSKPRRSARELMKTEKR